MTVMIEQMATTVRSILNVAENLAHAVAGDKASNLVHHVTDLVNTGISIGENVLQRVQDGTIVAHSESEEQIKDYIAKLRAMNDAEEAKIEAS